MKVCLATLYYYAAIIAILYRHTLTIPACSIGRIRCFEQSCKWKLAIKYVKKVNFSHMPEKNEKITPEQPGPKE